jgi:hypothetical protein
MMTQRADFPIVAITSNRHAQKHNLPLSVQPATHRFTGLDR